jgi:hypothetical protein
MRRICVRPHHAPEPAAAKARRVIAF